MLIITLGEPKSVFFELLSKTLFRRATLNYPVVIIGCQSLWEEQINLLGLVSLSYQLLSSPSTMPTVPGLYFLNSATEKYAGKSCYSLTPIERGKIAFEALLTLKKIPLAKKAILTGPIDKNLCTQAGFFYPGQTEYFAELAGCSNIMILAGQQLKVGLVTNHVAVKNIASMLTGELIMKKILLMVDALKTIFNKERPRLAVCGLNPHGSDHGKFGDEEDLIISPAIEKAKSHFGSLAEISGPHAADSVFLNHLRGHYDGVLCMYHDQGLGPIKTVDFETAVNISWGLPFLRISPDHGPAEDLFLKGQASSGSLERALLICDKYLTGQI